jgi:hypothetical protein
MRIMTAPRIRSIDAIRVVPVIGVGRWDVVTAAASDGMAMAAKTDLERLRRQLAIDPRQAAVP